MAARNEQKAKAAIERLHAEGLGPGNGEVLWHKLDLSDPRAVKHSAEEFMQREERLDVLSEWDARRSSNASVANRRSGRSQQCGAVSGTVTFAVFHADVVEGFWFPLSRAAMVSPTLLHA